MLFRSNGLNQVELASQENLVFVVRKCEVEFISPAKLDDEITVSIALKDLSFTTLKLYQEIKKSSKILSDVWIIGL